MALCETCVVINGEATAATVSRACRECGHRYHLCDEHAQPPEMGPNDVCPCCDMSEGAGCRLHGDHA